MIQIAQYISSRVQYKKRSRSGLRRGFLCCAIGEIDKSRCVSYFPTVPKLLAKQKHWQYHAVKNWYQQITDGKRVQRHQCKCRLTRRGNARHPQAASKQFFEYIICILSAADRQNAEFFIEVCHLPVFCNFTIQVQKHLYSNQLW